eukprot:CAMPEP_0183739966 /NCGR_PEP_ID=MMETSP0737-20130205/58522_1 /TAXON_ID=385413 /ORGANISM="Thalassiosira miniscula, Strain CCMP1093" /LENGTH=162 /DNA_ID=CAMNT_0025974913 /DNA_START=172 /DNA_END=656 /DNA_ORIENTATION=-
MCGIGLLLSLPAANDSESHDEVLLSNWNQRLSETLGSRGPDVPCRELSFDPGNVHDIDEAQERIALLPTTASKSQWPVTLHASVLHMRGQHPMAQPVPFPISQNSNGSTDARNCALCWNGECYTYCDKIQMDGERDVHSTECKHQTGNFVELISTTTAEEKS